VHLARREVERLTNGGEQAEDRAQFIESQLARADELFELGQTVEAHEIWTSIVNLYRDNKELRPLVEKAQHRLADGNESDIASGARKPPGGSKKRRPAGSGETEKANGARKPPGDSTQRQPADSDEAINNETDTNEEYPQTSETSEGVQTEQVAPEADAAPRPERRRPKASSRPTRKAERAKPVEDSGEESTPADDDAAALSSHEFRNASRRT